MSMTRLTVFHPCTKFMFIGFSVPKIWAIFGHGVNQPGDLDLWPFDISIGSRITCVTGFLPANFQLPMPFRFRGTGHTGGQSDDGHQHTMPQPYWGGRGALLNHFVSPELDSSRRPWRRWPATRLGQSVQVPPRSVVARASLAVEVSTHGEPRISTNSPTAPPPPPAVGDNCKFSPNRNSQQ